MQCEDPDGQARGAVLFTHGLNQHASSMSNYRLLARQSGYASCQLVLSGHEGTAGRKHHATTDAWRGEYLEAAEELRRRFPNQPLVSFNYSIGSAVAIAALDEAGIQPFDSLIFVVPALALRWSSTLLRPLLPLRVLNLSLPSFSPEKHRVYGSTSLDSYYAALALVDRVQQLEHPEIFRRSRGLVILSADDEMVSSEGALAWCKRHDLHWDVMVIDPEPTLSGSYNHLIVDEVTMGSTAWREVEARLLAHLAGLRAGDE